MRPIWPRALLAVLLLFALAVMLHGDTPVLPVKPPVMPLVMERGAQITSIQPGSPAEQAGLQVGDIIISVNGMDVTSEAKLNQMLKFSGLARLEVANCDDGRRIRVVAYPIDGDLGIKVRMVSPETAPWFPLYRRWI